MKPITNLPQMLFWNSVEPRTCSFHGFKFLWKIWSLGSRAHSCMPSPLAPDPIRVQPCVYCLFWTNRNSIAVTSIFLSISHYPIRDIWILQSALSVNGNIYFYWNYGDAVELDNWQEQNQFYLQTTRNRKD